MEKFRQINNLSEADQEALTVEALKFYQKSCKDKMIHPLEPDSTLTEIGERHISFFNRDGLMATVFCDITNPQFKNGLKMKVSFMQ